MRTFKDTVTFIFQVPDRTEFKHITFSAPLVAQGPPRESWTIPTWSLLGSEPAVEEGLTKLSASVEQLRQGILPRRSDELISLARDAMTRMTERRTEDLEEWARQLGRDVSDEND